MNRDTLVSPTTAADGPVVVGDIRPGVLLRDTYRVLRHLSSGGVGCVFVAAHERLPGMVAVKALHGEGVRDAEALARFRAEATVTARLRHPHIVQVLDFDVSPAGVPYFVMEYLDGIDLRAASGGQGPMPAPRVVHLVRQIAGALAAAHREGVIHRDLKPENVMLIEAEGERDFVKVVDFGLMKLIHHDGPRLTRNNQILGTPGYMPPELIVGRKLDDRVDQFALAAIAYELLSGRTAFEVQDTATMLREIVHNDPPPFASVVSWPAAAVTAVLARGMAKEPAERYPSVLEFEQALQAAVAADGASISG